MSIENSDAVGTLGDLLCKGCTNGLRDDFKIYVSRGGCAETTYVSNFTGVQQRRRSVLVSVVLFLSLCSRAFELVNF